MHNIQRQSNHAIARSRPKQHSISYIIFVSLMIFHSNHLPFAHFLMDYESSYSLLFLCVFFCCFTCTFSVKFSYPNFLDDNNINTSGTATRAQVDSVWSIRLSDNQIGGDVFDATGRAYFPNPFNCGIPSQM